VLIANYEPFNTDHLKISLANAVANGANTILPLRQAKLVTYGFGTFAYYTFKIIKNFIPKAVLDKL